MILNHPSLNPLPEDPSNPFPEEPSEYPILIEIRNRLASLVESD